MAKKTNPTSKEEWKDAYFEEKFKTVNGKLDELKDVMLTKASSTRVNEMADDICHLKKNKVDRSEFEPIQKATEGAVYFGKHPQQLKMVVIGALVVVVISVLTLVPSFLMLRKYSTELKNIEKTEKTK